MTELFLRIDGMSCNHCSNYVHKVVSEIQGVHSVEVNLNAHSAKLIYDEALCSSLKIISTINEIGYPAIRNY
jgi:copper chaperone